MEIASILFLTIVGIVWLNFYSQRERSNMTEPERKKRDDDVDDLTSAW